jgi:hypothetical protein
MISIFWLKWILWCQLIIIQKKLWCYIDIRITYPLKNLFKNYFYIFSPAKVYQVCLILSFVKKVFLPF